MIEKEITRRQMIKGSSLAALTLFSSSLVNDKESNTESNEINSNIVESSDDICFMNAVDMAVLLRTKKLSAREVMKAHLKQIANINSKVNALVTLVPEDQLMTQALAADELIATGKSTGSLHGLPLAVKDLRETKDIRTTYGSPLYKDYIPKEDDLIVKRQKNSGAIVIGKSNVPELGLGSQTFNPIFGPTLNPYDLSKTCGGSTGGGAVALACGMVPLADGSDTGGSLRNPASFCNVVGLRTSPGRVPIPNARLAWGILSVQGPMARTVSDCSLLLSAQAGPDNRSPLSIMENPEQFLKPLARNFKGVKIAFIKDFGLPWETEVIESVKAQWKVFESLGCIVEEAEPDMTDANECFDNFRHWQTEVQYGDLSEESKEKLHDYARWHITEGRKLTGPYLSRLEAKRSALYRRVQKFLEKYEYLILPVSQVLPFNINTPYPTKINGVEMLTYIDWMRSSYYISVVGNPALSVPCAFSKSGLPIGLQIVGRYNADFSVLQMGFAFEQATNLGKQRPKVVH